MDQFSDKEIPDGSTPIIHIVNRANLSDEQNIAYFHEYTKILETASFIHKQIIDLSDLKDSLAQTLSQIDQRLHENLLLKQDEQDYILQDQRPKRMRRVNSLIDKKFICPVKKCEKVYGSEGSLHQHIKIKHKGGIIMEEDDEDESYTLRKERKGGNRKNK